MFYNDRPWCRFLHNVIEWFIAHEAVGYWGVATPEQIVLAGDFPVGTYKEIEKKFKLTGYASMELIPWTSTILIDVHTKNAHLIIKSDEHYKLTAEIKHLR